MVTKEQAILQIVPSEVEVVVRILTGFGLAFVIGFERELRGSTAGDRTFSLVGGAVAAITAITFKVSPQAVAGAVTGIGFIGAGVVFHGESGLIRGVTTASAIFATAAVGVVVGSGHLAAGVVATAILLLVLELRNVPVLNRLDARRYQPRFRDDYQPPSAR